MNFNLPVRPQDWAQFVGPIIGIVALLLAVFGIGVGAGQGSSDRAGETETTVTKTTTAVTTVPGIAPVVQDPARPKPPIHTQPTVGPLPYKMSDAPMTANGTTTRITDTRVVPAKTGANPNDFPVVVYTVDVTNKADYTFNTFGWSVDFPAGSGMTLTPVDYDDAKNVTPLKPGQTKQLVQAYKLSDFERY